jgi:ribosomal protein L17
MSKNTIVIALFSLFLAASILFSLSQKKSYEKSLKNLKEESIQVEHIAALQSLWKAKGMKSKIEKIIKLAPSSKIERFNIKRGSADIKLNSLTDKEFNKILTKLAMLPLQFKKLQIVRSGNQFILECLCVW